MDVNDKIKNNLIKYLCENYVDVVEIGLEESECFVYTNEVIELLKQKRLWNYNLKYRKFITKSIPMPSLIKH